MEILTDQEGVAWRIEGDVQQVTVLRRAKRQEGKEEPRWRAVSYHNSLSNALTWLMDQMLRGDLETCSPERFMERISSWKSRLEGVAEYWRQSIKASVHDS